MQKNFIVALFGPKTSNQIIQKKSLRSILKLYVAATLSKKIRNITHANFLSNLKNLFLDLFWIHFGPKTTKQCFFHKYRLPQF